MPRFILGRRDDDGLYSYINVDHVALMTPIGGTDAVKITLAHGDVLIAQGVNAAALLTGSGTEA